MMPGNAEGRLPGEESAAPYINSPVTGSTENSSRVHVSPLSGTSTRNNSTDWRAEAAKVLGVLANTGIPFTCDTLTQLAGYPPDPHQLGTCLATAKQQRLIEVVGATIAENRLVRVWRGVA
jgi:hypothetical protein